MWIEQAHEIIMDMEEVDERYRPTHFWQFGASTLQAELELHGIENFRSLKGALSFFVPTYRFHGWATQEDKYQSMLNSTQKQLEGDHKACLSMQDFLSGEMHARNDYRVFTASNIDKAPFVESFSESQVGKPKGQFEFEGKYYSRSSLNYLLGLNFLKKHVAEVPIRTVLEIGGGFGSLGEILLKDQRNKTFYMNVDISPTCLFSTYYLQQNFGKERIADYKAIKKLPDLSLNTLSELYDGAVLCPWQLPEVSGELDLFVNFISFQEMEPDIVANYLEHVARLECKYVLLRNLKEGKQLATEGSHVGVKQPIKGEDYDKFLPDYELVATNVHPFGFETIDGFNSELRLYKKRYPIM